MNSNEQWKDSLDEKKMQQNFQLIRWYDIVKFLQYNCFHMFLVCMYEVFGMVVFFKTFPVLLWTVYPVFPCISSFFSRTYFLFLLLVQTKSAKACWCYPLSPTHGFLGLASMLLLKATQRIRFCISFPYYFQFCCIKFPPFLGQCLSFL